MNYDPTLDTPSSIISPPAETWPAAWIWFPGQLAAHLHTLVSQRSFRRCAHTKEGKLRNGLEFLTEKPKILAPWVKA